MKFFLRVASLTVTLATLGVWLATGAHRGWTETSVTVMKVEEVTGLQYPVTKRQFVMGVDLLGVGLAVAGGLAVAAFFCKPKSSKTI